jgi:hypothetical protein
LAVGAVLAVALATRVAAVMATRQYTPLTDALNFDHIARSILDGHGFGSALVPPATGATAFRAPLFPVVLAGVYKVLGVSLLRARLFEALVGALTVGLLGLVAAQIWGRREALIAMAVSAVYPPLILMTTSLQWEVLFLPLLLGAIACALAYRRRSDRLRLPIAAGCLLGLAALSRETGLLMVLPVGILVWQGARGARRPLLAVATVVGAMAVVLAPWVVRNEVRLDAFVPVSTSAGYALAGTYNNSAAHLPGSPGQWTVPVDDPHLRGLVLARGHWTEPELDAFFRRQSIAYLRHHPTYLGTLAVWNTVRLFDLRGPRDALFISQYIPYRSGLVRLTVYAWYLGAALAVVGALTAKARRAPWALWLAPLIVIASALFIVSGNIRYRQPIEPFVVLLAALGVDALLTRVGRRIPFLERLA